MVRTEKVTLFWFTIALGVKDRIQAVMQFQARLESTLRRRTNGFLTEKTSKVLMKNVVLNEDTKRNKVALYYGLLHGSCLKEELLCVIFE